MNGVPKILDVVRLRPSEGESGPVTGTILSLSGTPFPTFALVEIATEAGETSRIVSVPIGDLEITWSARQETSQPSVAEAQKLFEQALLLLQNGLTKDASQQFARAFELEPKFAGTLMNLTSELSKKGSFDSAIFLYQFILQLQPAYSMARQNLARAHLNRGVASARNGLFPEAMGDFQRALFFDSSEDFVFLCKRNIVAAYTALAIRHAEINQYGEALSLFMAAFQVEPSETTRKNLALATLGNLAVQSRGSVIRDPSVTNVFVDALLMGLTRSECLNAFGAALASVGSISDAVRTLERAVMEDPTNELAKSNLDRLTRSDQPTEPAILPWGVQPISPVESARVQA
jgi:tetratricopeptide (TPR) repeat protein